MGCPGASLRGSGDHAGLGLHGALGDHHVGERDDGHLPAEQRKVILLWSQGASIREMAAACDAPTDTVLSRKKYAVARLRGTIGGTLQAACGA